MSADSLRDGVLAAYRDALVASLVESVIATRERWCELHPALDADMRLVTEALLREFDVLIPMPPHAVPAPQPDGGWDIEAIAQEYVADMKSWPPERRNALPTQIREAVTARVQAIRELGRTDTTAERPRYPEDDVE